MRFAIVAVAGLIGWLWFATREPEAPTAPAPARARRADLSDLHTQVAAAARAPRAAAAIDSDGAIDDDSESRRVYDIIPTSGDELVDGEARSADLSELLAQLEAAAERDVEDPTDVPNDDEAIGHEIIQISGAAPIIDPTTTTTGCYTIELEYTKNIPVPGRTFEGVLGAAADSQSQEYGVSFSSNDTIENTYIVEDHVVDEDHLIVDEPATEDVVDLEGGIVIVD